MVEGQPQRANKVVRKNKKNSPSQQQKSHPPPPPHPPPAPQPQPQPAPPIPATRPPLYNSIQKWKPFCGWGRCLLSGEYVNGMPQI